MDNGSNIGAKITHTHTHTQTKGKIEHGMEEGVGRRTLFYRATRERACVYVSGGRRGVKWMTRHDKVYRSTISLGNYSILSDGITEHAEF